MPDTTLKTQALDLAFHPLADILFVGLLDGQIRCYSYDSSGDTTLKWKTRPSKKSCRALDVRHDGSHLWGGNKSGSIHTIDTETGSIVGERLHAHETAISRIITLGSNMNMFASGDDNGVIKIWDSRSPASDASAIRTLSHHTDYISDFAWLSGKRHLVATSGDGTLSVIDVRSNKTKPFAQSEDQEDELLSVVPIKGGAKLVIGTQLGPLSIFDRAKGYADCVDRFLGHPSSVETMVSLSSSQITQDVIATGSSDGLIRVVQIHPSKFLGVIAAHGTTSTDQEGEDSGKPGQSNTEGFPIERMKLDRNGKWLASISHDEILKLTDVEGALEGSDEEEEEYVDADGLVSDQSNDDDEEQGQDEGEHDSEHDEKEESDAAELDESDTNHAVVADEQGSESESSTGPTDKQSKKRKKRELKREERKKRKKSGPVNTFFADL
ncbi:hypothetical protein M408DRAFT_329837 [Serendipita vermifera MAFF 305830]|uniref:WD repeat-containing protein JIP5 n=1 Tax=Serendipita vermifera MAFF 305830 TaxID=933852 RepID=A0A0C3B700_SERVB|nr:hypothetical protein M408DRAFT_329837 [Serendipita vermifera MAFF 305830]